MLWAQLDRVSIFLFVEEDAEGAAGGGASAEEAGAGEALRDVPRELVTLLQSVQAVVDQNGAELEGPLSAAADAVHAAVLRDDVVLHDAPRMSTVVAGDLRPRAAVPAEDPLEALAPTTLATAAAIAGPVLRAVTRSQEALHEALPDARASVTRGDIASTPDAAPNYANPAARHAPKVAERIEATRRWGAVVARAHGGREVICVYGGGTPVLVTASARAAELLSPRDDLLGTL
jgi:hypothetical protein